MTKKIGGYLGPLPRNFFPKSTNQNFNIAMLFNLIENLITISFGDDLIPHSPSPLLKYSNGYYEVYRRFQGTFSGWGGGGSGVTWEVLSMEEFIMRQENFHEGCEGFSSII